MDSMGIGDVYDFCCVVFKLVTLTEMGSQKK